MLRARANEVQGFLIGCYFLYSLGCQPDPFFFDFALLMFPVGEIDRLLASTESIVDLTKGVYLCQFANHLLGLEHLSSCFSAILSGKADYEISEEAKFVRAYLKKHPQCSTLFELWLFQQEAKLVKIEGLVLGVFSRLLNLLSGPMRRTAGAEAAGNAICKRIINNTTEAWLSMMHRNLASDTIPLIQNTLRLLCSLAAFNPPMFLRDIQAKFDLGAKSLSRLLRYRKSAQISPDGAERLDVPTDVRSLYIKFLCTFIKHGDANVKKQCLETKDLVSAAVKGLSEDVYETAVQFLDVLDKHIVKDNTLGKSTKISLFNGYVLEQV